MDEFCGYVICVCYKDRLSALSPMSLSKEESASACVWCCLSVEVGAGGECCCCSVHWQGKVGHGEEPVERDSCNADSPQGREREQQRTDAPLRNSSTPVHSRLTTMHLW